VITGHILSALFIAGLGGAAVAILAAAAVLVAAGAASAVRWLSRVLFPARRQATEAAR
jgi:hypothetical protein